VLAGSIGLNPAAVNGFAAALAHPLLELLLQVRSGDVHLAPGTRRTAHCRGRLTAVSSVDLGVMLAVEAPRLLGGGDDGGAAATDGERLSWGSGQ
jgi:hypothetical protein